MYDFFNFVTKIRLAFQNDFMNIHIFGALPDANWTTLIEMISIWNG